MTGHTQNQTTMTGTIPPKNEKVRAVTHVCDMLRQRVNELEDVTTALLERLVPVLSQPDPQPDDPHTKPHTRPNDTDVGREDLCPLGAELRLLAERVNNAQRHLRDLYNRTQV